MHAGVSHLEQMVSMRSVDVETAHLETLHIFSLTSKMSSLYFSVSTVPISACVCVYCVCICVCISTMFVFVSLSAVFVSVCTVSLQVL